MLNYYENGARASHFCYISNTQKHTKIMEKFEQVWKFLEEKGLTIGERMTVKNFFMAEGKKIKDVRQDGDEFFSTIEGLTSHVFKSEKEVLFFNALHELMPDVDTHNLSNMMGIIFKLCDIDSAWKFKINSHNRF